MKRIYNQFFWISLGFFGFYSQLPGKSAFFYNNVYVKKIEKNPYENIIMKIACIKLRKMENNITRVFKVLYSLTEKSCFHDSQREDFFYKKYSQFIVFIPKNLKACHNLGVFIHLLNDVLKIKSKKRPLQCFFDILDDEINSILYDLSNTGNVFLFSVFYDFVRSLDGCFYFFLNHKSRLQSHFYLPFKIMKIFKKHIITDKNITRNECIRIMKIFSQNMEEETE